MLVPRVFALLRWDDPQSMDIWARVVCPHFEGAFLTNADRFLKHSLDAIKAGTAIFIFERASGLTGKQFPDILVDAATHLAAMVDVTEFERFKRTLSQTAAIVKTEPQDLNTLLASVGLDSSIADAMREFR